ncbi:MAG TPA: response regulator, partial [Gemmatimonadales bacterium]|nr:response regulator [Gemmatimonadales bacterium]
ALGLEPHRLTSLRDPERLAALHRTGLLDQPPDPALDRLARLAARAVGAPAAVICLVTDEREFFAGQAGLPEPQASARGGPLSRGLCQYAVADRAPLVVADTRRHPELAHHPAVTELGIAAVACVPLFDADGRAVGALAVLDRAPRPWSEDDVAGLQDLAGLAATRLPRRDGAASPKSSAARSSRSGAGLGPPDPAARRAPDQRRAQTERSEAVAQLAGGIAHDFNNLLTGILGHVTLLREEPGLSPLGREDLSQIQQSAERAASLTRRLLAFTRRQSVAPRVLDLNQLVTGALTRLRRVAGATVRLGWTPAPGLDPIVADPNQLEQVLVHLTTMARDSMPQGGTLELATRQERRGGESGRPSPRSGGYVVLEVRDTGRGMDATTIDQAMEPLLASASGGGRAGLGLASVYGIVRQAGGLVEIQSEPERGSTFTLSFPRHEGSGPVSDPAVGDGEPAGGSETILLVEDEEQVRELARRVLERVGYTVLAAGDPAAATAIADRHAGHIHLLITDMQLPQLSGRELAARLGIHRPAIKVLYISGTADDSAARLRLLEPGTHFLEKPFSLDRLLRTIRTALGDPVAGARSG